MPRVLVVDDEKGIRMTLAEFLKSEGYIVDVACDAEEALRLARNNEFDVVVADIILPRTSGLKLLAELRGEKHGPQVILITGDPNMDGAAHALRMGAFDYLAKPINRRDILSSVAAAVRSELGTPAPIGAGESSNPSGFRAPAPEELIEGRERFRESNQFHRHKVLTKRMAISLEDLDQLPMLYRTIYSQIRQVMDTAMFIISSFKVESGLIRALYAVNDGEEMDVESLPPIPLAKQGRGRQSHVIRTGDPLVMSSDSETRGKSDVEYTVTSSGQVVEGLTNEPDTIVRSALFVPVKIKNEVIGVIQVQSYREGAYSDEDLDLLLCMAAVAAVPISRIA